MIRVKILSERGRVEFDRRERCLYIMRQGKQEDILLLLKFEILVLLAFKLIAEHIKSPQEASEIPGLLCLHGRCEIPLRKL